MARTSTSYFGPPQEDTRDIKEILRSVLMGKGNGPGVLTPNAPMPPLPASAIAPVPRSEIPVQSAPIAPPSPSAGPSMAATKAPMEAMPKAAAPPSNLMMQLPSRPAPMQQAQEPNLAQALREYEAARQRSESQRTANSWISGIGALLGFPIGGFLPNANRPVQDVLEKYGFLENLREGHRRDRDSAMRGEDMRLRRAHEERQDARLQASSREDELYKRQMRLESEARVATADEMDDPNSEISKQYQRQLQDAASADPRLAPIAAGAQHLSAKAIQQAGYLDQIITLIGRNRPRGTSGRNRSGMSSEQMEQGKRLLMQDWISSNHLPDTPENQQRAMGYLQALDRKTLQDMIQHRFESAFKPAGRGGPQPTNIAPGWRSIPREEGRVFSATEKTNFRRMAGDGGALRDLLGQLDRLAGEITPEDMVVSKWKKSEKYARAQKIVAQIRNIYRSKDFMNTGVLNPHEIPMLEAIVPAYESASAFLNARTDYRTLAQSIDSAMTARARDQYGQMPDFVEAYNPTTKKWHRLRRHIAEQFMERDPSMQIREIGGERPPVGNTETLPSIVTEQAE